MPKGSSQKVRFGIVVDFPTMPEGYYVSGKFTPKSPHVGYKSEATSCSVCEGHIPHREAWAFQHVPGQFCVNCAPAAEERCIELMAYSGSLASIMNGLARLVPRELRILEHNIAERKWNVLDAGIEAVRSAILNVSGEARFAVIIAVQKALDAFRWEELPESDPGFSDPKEAAVDRLERFIQGVAHD